MNDIAALTADERSRYSRHLLLPEVGAAGQDRLRRARVLVVGAGGLGSPAALYLAAAGVGTLGIADFDRVELSNLQRQILHGTASVGQPKAESARARLHDMNPGVDVPLHEERLTSKNARAVLSGYDVVVDGTDNFPTRYLLNDVCVMLGIPYAYGSIYRFEGQASLFATPDGPCYRCLYPEPPPPGLVPTCAEGGVLGVLPGIIGSIQALEAIKWVLGAGESLAGRLLLFDALRVRFRELHLRKDPECPMCGVDPSTRQLIDYEAFCGVGSSEPALEISSDELKAERARGEPLTLIDVREPGEWEVRRIDGARLMPLGQLAARHSELDRAGRIVVYCERGSRSARAADELRSAGFTDVRSLRGGIATWDASERTKDA